MLTTMEQETAAASILLGGLPPDLAANLIETGDGLDLARGQALFAQGTPARHVFVVLSGWIKLRRISATGEETVVAVFTAGQSFAEIAAFQGGGYPVDAEAATEARVLRIDAAALLRRMEDDPRIARALIAASYAHLHGLVRQIEGLKAMSGAQRVGEFLLELAGTRSGACTVHLPHDKSLVAGRLGLKPASLSRAFARLKEAGVAIHNAEAEIADVAVLEAFVERDRAEFWRRG
ncbi:Crp/Fnr family transcriptional regulator [Rhodovulum sp. DZ06]|uniref:Crp/Fnr family transcriptional regulator n=1 Tax=Rhodovulum sp. DZ06 TaxID=3425126 RepID=UPI003D33CEFB